MITSARRLTVGAAALTVLGLSLAACSTATEEPAAEATDAAAAEPTTIEVEDNAGTQTVTVPPTSVIATDNRLFETLADWDITLVAAPRALMPDTISYASDDSVVDLGNHREPDLEAVVALDPDLIINGQRFSQYAEDFATVAPNATIVDTSPRDDQPFGEELKRQITTLGEIFQSPDDAAEITDAYDAAVERVVAAYDPEDTVMGLITSGGEIAYAAPGSGRTLGPLFTELNLTPALEVEGEDEHAGQDVSVEAIADANPDWILAMDRDAGVSTNGDGEEYTPADELLAGSEALQNVTAVTEGNILYMPQDTYLNEGIQTYTEYLNQFADALEAKN